MGSVRRSAWLTAAVALVLHLLGHAGVLPLGFPEAWMMVALATLTSVLGYRWVLPLTAGASLLDALLSTGQSLLELTALYAVSSLLAAWLGARLRHAFRERKRASHLLNLLIRAQKELSGLDSRGEVLEALPAILEAYGQGNVSVWEPSPAGEGFVRVAASRSFPQDYRTIPEHGVVGRAFAQRRSVHVTDVASESDYVPVPGRPARCELALPLVEQTEAVAVLNLEYPEPLGEEALQALLEFAEGVSRRLSRLVERTELSLLENLNRTMYSAESLPGLGERVLALLGQVLDFDSGALVRQEGSRLRAVTFWGDVHPQERALLEEGIPFGQGLAWGVHRTGQPVFNDKYATDERGLQTLKDAGVQALVLHPIPLPGSARVRFMLGFQSRRQRHWRQSEKELLARACRAVGLALEGMLERQHTQTLLELQQTVLELSPEAAYHRILQTAVAMVPGAEAGTLMARQGEVFVFRAVHGFSLEDLHGVEFSLSQQQAWHGDLESWERGLPRVRSSAIVESSLESGLTEGKVRDARVREIQANLHLPIRYGGEVLALLNLDNLHDPLAFDQDSLRAAQLFAPAVATLLHDLRYRQRLEEAALTDVLTGLLNRRAFDLRLSEELERARRYAYPVSLLVMDLSGFKAINDRLGHEQGDRALQAVAQALRQQRRNGDSLYRWGGDEFAAILPHADLEGAVAAGTRYHRAIGALEVGGMRLGVNIGASCFPTDTEDSESLLRLADNRMYQAKSRGMPLSAG
ncbi:putative diguanylate cyclase YdaM [Calidithermus terrae]|uniref:Putative diguanylate cyclase YdaM n=2 Tax=Calidithermus terrae TaxID=1408545 RepID=A0A399F387_9DEIN|nr:putative diguanylate cyclase YdaM [Calidithermus terrae]